MKKINVVIEINNNEIAVADGNVRNWYSEVLKQEPDTVNVASMIQYIMLQCGVSKKEIKILSVTSGDKTYPLVDDNVAVETIDDFSLIDELLWETL